LGSGRSLIAEIWIDSAVRFCDEAFGRSGTHQELKQKHIMNWKKFFFAFIAAFGFIFLFGFLWYGKLMHGPHQEVPILWRTETVFGNHFSTLVFGHIVMAFFLTLLCARFVPAGGAGACAVMGILVALVYAGADMITFAVQPLTTKILWGWIVGVLIQFTIGGAIIGALYKAASANMMFVKERPR
jgi:hypothetical protein